MVASLVKPIDPKDPEQFPSSLTIKCGSLDVQAHSSVLCRDSAYFKVVCKGGFLVKFPNYAVLRNRVLPLTSAQEEQTQELKLPAEEEFLIRRLLCHRYTTGYDDGPYDDEENPPQHIEAPAYVNRMHTNAQMYSIADKYDMPSLKAKASEKFDAAIWEHYRCGGGSSSSSSLADEIIKVIPLVYESTPDRDRGLRDQLVQGTILRWEELEKHPRFGDLVAAAPEFVREARSILFFARLDVGDSRV